jgi:hypothetical protein
MLKREKEASLGASGAGTSAAVAVESIEVHQPRSPTRRPDWSSDPAAAFWVSVALAFASTSI